MSHLDKENKKCVFKDDCKNNPCHSNESCVDLKNGKSSCVNLNCPGNYENDMKEKTCIKNFDDLKTSDPISLTKRILILPVNLLQKDNRKKIYAFKRVENDDDINDFKFEIDVVNQSGNESPVDSSYFELIQENLSHDLYLIKPITKSMELIVKMNIIFRKRKLHTSELFVFIV